MYMPTHGAHCLVRNATAAPTSAKTSKSDRPTDDGAGNWSRGNENPFTALYPGNRSKPTPAAASVVHTSRCRCIRYIIRTWCEIRIASLHRGRLASVTIIILALSRLYTSIHNISACGCVLCVHRRILQSLFNLRVEWKPSPATSARKGYTAAEVDFSLSLCLSIVVQVSLVTQLPRVASFRSAVHGQQSTAKQYPSAVWMYRRRDRKNRLYNTHYSRARPLTSSSTRHCVRVI